MSKSAYRELHKPRKSTVILLGGPDKPCECKCGRTFPASKSCNWVVRKYFDPDCARKARYDKKKAGLAGVNLDAQARAIAAAQKKAVGQRWREPPYNRHRECLTDSTGRLCTCENYGDCSNLWEQGQPTRLEVLIIAGVRQHCYQPSSVTARGYGIAGSEYGISSKRFGPRMGAE